jgi:hypothetical protein
MYHITDYTRQRASDINVEVKVSDNPKKKIDIYKNGKFIYSIGNINYKDFPTYLRENGEEYALRRKFLYHTRHTKNSIGEALAKWLLW